MKFLRPSERALNPIFSRSVEDILLGDAPTERSYERIPFTMPKEKHPICDFFSERARFNAATMEVRKSVMVDPNTVEVGDYYSTNVKRPVHPAYFFKLDLPYPVGYGDYNGSLMSYGGTPTAYLLYYDRTASNRNLWCNTLMKGSDRRELGDLWIAFLRTGMWLTFDEYRLRQWANILFWCDPLPHWVPEMMFDPDQGSEANQAAYADVERMHTLVTAFDDFQYRWNCGEWFDHNSSHWTGRALKTVLGIAI